MAIEIRVPQVSDGVTSGTVTSLAVAIGDQVTEDQTLLELETDKAVVSIPSPQAGTITAIHVAEGDQAEVGSVIMLLQARPEAKVEPSVPVDRPQDVVAVPDLPPSQSTTEPAAAKPQTLPTPSASPSDNGPASGAGSVDLTLRRNADQVAPAAPSVRRIARELGVDIYQVQGSGPGGRISEQDVRAFVRSTMLQVSGGGVAGVGKFRGLHAQRPLPDFGRWGDIERRPMSKVRQVTADAMGYAWSTIPLVTQYDQAAVGALETFRQRYNDNSPEIKLTMTAILLKVCAGALEAFPRFNSSPDLAARELIYKKYINIGVAVDTDNGLLVPVVRDVNRKGVARLATELNALAEKARARKLGPDEMDGGTFTISNLGGIGGTSFTPIVYAPQVAILGVSRTETRPVWNGREFVPQQLMPFSLSYDHRVIDGADGARFLRWICEALEQPLRLLM